MTSQYRKPLPNSDLEYFDTRQAVNDITPDAYDKLPYTSRILAEQLVRKVTDSNELTAAVRLSLVPCACGVSRHLRSNCPCGLGRLA